MSVQPLRRRRHRWERDPGRLTILVSLLGLGLASPAAGPAWAADELVCVFDQDFPPFSYLENGRPLGLDVDLPSAAAGTQGIRLLFRPLPWSQAKAQMAAGQAHIISGLTDTGERRKLYRFLDQPYATLTSLVFIKEGGRIGSLEDLAGRRVGTLGGSSYEAVLRARPGVAVVTFESEALALKALAAGQVEACAGSELTARHGLAKLGLTGIKALPQPLNQEPLYFAVGLGQEGLAARLQEGLQALRASGEFDRIEKRWLVR